MSIIRLVIVALFAVSLQTSTLSLDTNIFDTSLDHITIATSVFSSSNTDQAVTVTYQFDPLYTVYEANSSGIPERECAIDNDQHTVVCENIASDGNPFDVHIVAQISTLPCATRQAHIQTQAVSGSNIASDDSWLRVVGQDCRVFIPIVIDRDGIDHW